MKNKFIPFIMKKGEEKHCRMEKNAYL